MRKIFQLLFISICFISICACNIETPDAFENSVAYIKSWLEVLENDERLILQASGKAQKAVEYILNANKDEV